MYQTNERDCTIANNGKTTNIVPLSTNFSKIRSPYSTVDERQYQPWSPETSEASLIPNSNTNEATSGSCKKYLTTKLFMSIFIGLVVCGIPLAVMSSLYALKKASSNTTSGYTGTSSNNSAILPTQCTTYIINSDPSRLISYTSCGGTCPYDSTGYFTAGWYRFTDGTGTRIATTPPSVGSCGASLPVWCNGTFPSTSGSTISTMGCINNAGYLCSSAYSIQISITNCNTYYVFYLQPTTSTSILYCTTY